MDNSFADIRLAFLDRDGVLNRKPKEGDYVVTWSNSNSCPMHPKQSRNSIERELRSWWLLISAGLRSGRCLKPTCNPFMNVWGANFRLMTPTLTAFSTVPTMEVRVNVENRSRVYYFRHLSIFRRYSPRMRYSLAIPSRILKPAGTWVPEPFSFGDRLRLRNRVPRKPKGKRMP